MRAALFAVAAARLMLRGDSGDFGSLNSGSQEYFASMEKLWAHPWRNTDFQTFEESLKNWFAQMVTSSCGGLQAQPDRKVKLTAACKDPHQDWAAVWKFFTQEEIKWFKRSYPNDAEDHFGAGFSYIHDTVSKLSRKELLCATMFTIDDNCVDSRYVRLAKNK